MCRLKIRRAPSGGVADLEDLMVDMPFFQERVMAMANDQAEESERQTTHMPSVIRF
jgi:hypothetical protein